MQTGEVSILIVDDEASNRELLNCYLSAGYQCTMAENAEQAMQRLEARVSAS